MTTETLKARVRSRTRKTVLGRIVQAGLDPNSPHWQTDMRAVDILSGRVHGGSRLTTAKTQREKIYVRLRAKFPALAKRIGKKNATEQLAKEGAATTGLKWETVRREAHLAGNRRRKS